MATTSISLSYIGQGPSAGGQNIADQTSGPKAKTLYGYGALVATSGTWASPTSCPINWIDGVQSLGKVVVLQLQSVDVTDGTYTTYHSTGPDSSVPVGTTVTIAGFSTGANNGSFVVHAVTSSTIVVVSAAGVAEINPAATCTFTVGGVPTFVNLFYAGSNGDSATAAASFATGANIIVPSAVSSTGCTANYKSLATSGVSVTIGAIIAFSS
jgi:hypothetical protein